MGKSKNLVLIGDIPLNTTEIHMRGVFSQFGQIKDIYFHDFPTFEDERLNAKETGAIGHYCLIAFSRKDSVEKCIFSSVEFKGKILLVMKVKEDEMRYILNQKKKKKSKNSDDEMSSSSNEDGEEKREKDMDVIKKLGQHIYVAFKLKQDKAALRLIDYFYRYIRKITPFKMKIGGMKQIVGTLDIKDFKAELLADEIMKEKPGILSLQQILFWMKTSILIKFQEDTKLIEHFVFFMKYYFKPINLYEADKESLKLIKAMWSIKFVNLNYNFVESKIKLTKERNQHWMVFLLSLLQESYYEMAKTFYSYNEDYSDIFARYDLFLEMTESDKNIFKPKLETKREHFDVDELFPIKKDQVIRGLCESTNNLLTHNFYKTHPRRFIIDYIKSIELLLSLKSKRVFEFAGEWIELNIECLSLCQAFPSIFRVIVVHRATYQLRKNDYEASILNLMDFLSARNELSREDYQKAVERITQLSKYVEKPINRKLEQYLNISGGKISLNKTNQIQIKLYMSSDIYATFKSLKVIISVIDSSGKTQTLEHQQDNFEVLEGDLCWEFMFKCPNLGSDVITFERLEADYLNTQYIVQSNNQICLNNAMDCLNFDIKAEGLHLLSNFKNQRGNVTVKSLMLHGRVNYGALYFQVFCHEVAIKLKMKFIFLNLVEFKEDIVVYGLRTGEKWEFKAGDGPIEITDTKDKEFVALFKFSPLSFIETLATPVIDARLEIFIPCNKSIIRRILKRKLRCYNSKGIKLNQERRNQFYSFCLNNHLNIGLHLKKITIAGEDKAKDVQLSSGEAYSTFYYDAGNSDVIETKVVYNLKGTEIGMNPLFLNWFEKSEDENLKEVLTVLKKEFKSIQEEENEIVLNLKKPFPGPKLAVKIETPAEASLGSVIKLKYRLEHLAEGKAYFVTQLDEGDDEEIVSFINKTIHLVEFTPEVKVKEVILEALVVRTGIYRIPDLIITDFKERKNMLMNDLEIDKTQAVEFIQVKTNDEISCRLENNLFNDISREGDFQEAV